MKGRAKWARLLKENGYTLEAIATMDDSSFRDITNNLIKLGFSAAKEPWADFLRFTQITPNESRKHVQYSFNFTSGNDDYNPASTIRNDQDVLYQDALIQMQQLEAKIKKAEQEEKERMQAKIEKEKKELEIAKQKIIQKAKNIPSDDQLTGDKCTILVILPGGRQIKKCFSIRDKIEYIYDWVACFDEMFDDNPYPKEKKSVSSENKDANATFIMDLENKIDELGMPLPFTLIKPPDEVLDQKKTLAEQKLLRRVLLNVVVDD